MIFMCDIAMIFLLSLIRPVQSVSFSIVYFYEHFITCNNNNIPYNNSVLLNEIIYSVH